MLITILNNIKYNYKYFQPHKLYYMKYQSITIWVSNLILVGLQFTHEMMFHHFKTLLLCCQGITGEFTNSKDLIISLYMCVLCEILSLRVSPDQFSSLFLNLSLQCYCSSLFSIHASYHQYWFHFLKTKENTMHCKKWKTTNTRI